MSVFDPVVPDDLDVLRSKRGYSPGVRTGNLLFISGMLGRRADLSIVEEPEALLAQMFDNRVWSTRRPGATGLALWK